MSIKFKKIEKCKGLNQTFDFPELPLDYAHRLKNIDVDDPLGKMRVRDGYSKKYSTAFTGISSAYEYYFKEADETKLFINDNGSIKISTDGGAFGAAETLPTGATIETGFKCHWMGYKNHVLMTTGSGDTNYILGYYYVNRVNADNTGLFHNQEENTGYVWSKSQLITPHGFFSDIYNVVYLGGYYFVSFNNSSFIEKKDSDFKTISRFKPYEAITDKSIVALDSDGTYLYIGTPDGLYKYDADTLLSEDSITTSTFQDILGICNDGTNLYAITSTGLEEVLLSSFTDTGIGISGLTSGTDICCDSTVNTGYVFTIENNIVYRRNKTDFSSTHTNNTYNLIKKIEHDGNSQVVVLRTGSGHVYNLDETDVTEDNDYTEAKTPAEFIWISGTTLRVISLDQGWVQSYDDGDIHYPRLISLTGYDSDASYLTDLDSGTYFYKISIIDTDGQEYGLSDSIFINNNGSEYNVLYLSVNLDDLNDLYRVKGFNIYRAYASDIESEEPGTDYKFLVYVDINELKDGGEGNYLRWNDQSLFLPSPSSETFYTVTYRDHTTEAEISDVTYFENSGIGDAVKPRYVNGKYFTWLDDQLHLANFSHDGDTYPSRILRSATNAPDAISFYDYYDFDVSEGDAIIGISNLYGRSVVWKTRKMATFYDGSQEREFVEGLSAENGYFAKDDAIYFISNKGIHVFDGNRVYDLTDNARYYFELDSDLERVGMFYFENKNRVVWSIHSGSAPRTIVFNIKHKTWTYYDKAWKGFFKNNSNEYIGWQTEGGNDYICELFDGSTKDLEDVGGGNGTSISIEYQSPLIKMSDIDGLNSMLFGYWWRGICSGTLSIKLYKYKTDGKTLIDTYTISSPTNNAAVKNHWLNSEWGESYSITIDGSTPTTPASQDASFNFHSITFKLKEIGMVNAI